jgi:peptidyl-prolyl cis-trans isomerase D
MLRLSRLTPGDFERSQREDLLIAKLEQLLKDGVHTVEAEVREAFVRDKEQVSAEYLSVDPSAYASEVQVDEAEERASYDEGRERFLKPEQIRAAYLLIDPQAYTDRVQVTDDQIAQYYEAHQEEFRQDARVHARHILFRLPPQATPEEESRVRVEAEAVLKQAQAGEDFAALAGQFSGDPGSAQQGGDLGFFKRGAMVKPFEDVALTLKPGEVSDLVRTDFGYHIIKVEETQEEGYTPLESVREQVRAQLSHEEAGRVAKAQAKAVRDALVAGGGAWENTAATFQLHSRETPLIARGDAVADIPDPAAFSQAAFALQVGEVSQPTLMGTRYALIRLLERKDAYIPPFEEVQAAVHEALIRSRSAELARHKADEVLTDVRGGKPLEEVAQALQAQVEQTGFFSRSSSIPKLGRPADVIGEIFRMGLGEARVFVLQEKPAVLVLKERTGFDAEAYAKEREQVNQRVLQQKRDRFFAQWLSDLRQSAEDRHLISLNGRLLALL